MMQSYIKFSNDDTFVFYNYQLDKAYRSDSSKKMSKRIIHAKIVIMKSTFPIFFVRIRKKRHTDYL